MDAITMLCEMVTGEFWINNYPEDAIEALRNLDSVPEVVDEEETEQIGHVTDEQLMDAYYLRRAEFVQDDPADMDEAAVRILMKSVFWTGHDLEVA